METVKLKKTKQNSYMLSYNGEEYMYFDFADLIEGVITHVGLKYEDELTKKQRKALIKATADGSTERLLCARITEMEKTLESRKNTIKLLRAEIVELKRTF
jgi:hypothetical protein